MDAPETAEPPRQRSGEGAPDPQDPDRPRRDPLEFDLTDATGRLAPGDALWLRARAAAAGARVGATGEVRVRIVADTEMAGAHQRLMGVGGTTDVITSDLGAGACGGELDADLLVCLDEAERQARARRHSVRKELLLYIVHGLLHCLGHDDRDEQAAARMHALEDETLAAIGVGPVFARGIGLPPDGGEQASRGDRALLPHGHPSGLSSPGTAMPRGGGIGLPPDGSEQASRGNPAPLPHGHASCLPSPGRAMPPGDRL